MCAARGDDGRVRAPGSGEKRGDPWIPSSALTSSARPGISQVVSDFALFSPAAGEPLPPSGAGGRRTFPERRPETPELGGDARVEVTTWL